MKLLKSERLFFGCKIDSKLREALAMAKPGDRRYFEDPNSEFLRVVQVDEERWIGKVVPGGVQLGEVDDISRNIISILRRIAPNIRTSGSSLKIFAVQIDGDVQRVIDEPEASSADGGESASGGEGPYIEY
jgi:hypothetical protein